MTKELFGPGIEAHGIEPDELAGRGETPSQGVQTRARFGVCRFLIISL